MNEQKETGQGKEQENPTQNNGDGVQSPTASFIQKLDELKQENARLEKNLIELRELKSSELMGSSAGVRKEPEAKQENPKERAKNYAQSVMTGKI